ncbi:MAG: ribonuclease III [Bryobacteraceae bacterium]
MVESEQELLEKLLGHRFRRPEWLECALTHSSWHAEHVARQEAGSTGAENGAGNEDNEKLEFLGDAVLTLVVSESLLKDFPEWNEGRLSKARASLVNAGALAEAAKRLDLGAFLRLGRGEEKTGGRGKTALLADAYEAVIAALYLDAGLAAVRGFIERSLLDVAVAQRAGQLGQPDDKSRLQEMLQARGWPNAEYRVVGETGPDHRKIFEVEVRIAGRASALGHGTTKKEAEQAAAEGAIEQVNQAGLSAEETDVGNNSGS